MIRLESDTVRVDLEHIGEGLCDDYNAFDPDDVALMRFDVYRKVAPGSSSNFTDWEPVDNASYCTQIPADAPDYVHAKYAVEIFNEVNEPVNAGHSIKKLCERLSWLGDA